MARRRAPAMARKRIALRAALDELRPTLDADAGWIDITVAGLVLRLRDLVDVMQDCRLLREAIADGRDPDQLKLAFNSDTLTVAVPHRDHGLALWAAVATALSVLSLLCVLDCTGWADGASAALFAALAGSFLAGLDDPRPAFRTFGVVILVVIAISGIYTFGVLPRVTTIEMLIAALAPAFLLFGWMAARPATARAGSWFAIFTSVQLALQSSYEGSFASFANASVALFVGVALTAVTCGIVRFLGTDWIASRLLRSNWKTLAAVAERKSPTDRVAIASLMQHRLALLAARIAVVPAEAQARRRQSAPAANGAEHHPSPAGAPVTPRNGGDRRTARPSCCRFPGPRGRPASGRTGRTARRYDRIDVARGGERGPQ